MKFGDLRGILQYVPQFRGCTFVLAVDGEIVASPNWANICLDLAVLHSLNVRLVIVHGASHQVRALAGARGVEITNSDGSGVTDEATLEVSIDAITRLTHKIMQDLTTVGMRAATANALIAHRAGVVSGVDLHHTGAVGRVDAKSLRVFLEDNMIPLVAPLAYDGRGNTLRVNSDMAATETALALKADKILFVSAGSFTGQIGETLRQRSVAEAEATLDAKADVLGKFASKLKYAARACREGIPRVHIVDGCGEDAILAELFSNEGIGTMVYADDYQQIRPVKPGDVPALVSLIQQSVAEEELVNRSADDIQRVMDDYFLLEVDGNPVGCVALHPYMDEKLAELACLYIKRDHENQGYGRVLVRFAEKVARESGAGRIFALTTRAFEYFRDHAGYRESGDLEVLPAARRRRLQESGRNSRLMVKDL